MCIFWQKLLTLLRKKQHTQQALNHTQNASPSAARVTWPPDARASNTRSFRAETEAAGSLSRKGKRGWPCRSHCERRYTRVVWPSVLPDSRAWYRNILRWQGTRTRRESAETVPYLCRCEADPDPQVVYRINAAGGPVSRQRCVQEKSSATNTGRDWRRACYSGSERDLSYVVLFFLKPNEWVHFRWEQLDLFIIILDTLVIIKVTSTAR